MCSFDMVDKRVGGSNSTLAPRQKRSHRMSSIFFYFELNIKASYLDSDSTKLARSTSFDPKVPNDFNSLESHFNKNLNVVKCSFDFVAKFPVTSQPWKFNNNSIKINT
jgi:hypothetical protein